MAQVDESTASAREQLDLILRVFAKRWLMVFVLTLSGGIAAFGTAKILSPVYEASTTVRILKEPGLAEAAASKRYDRGSGTLQAEVSWFSSQQVLDVVVQRLALADTPPASLFEAEVSRARTALKKVLNIQEADSLRVHQVTERLRTKCIKVKELENSNVLEIRVNWSTPEMTMRIANTLVDVFTEQFQEFNRGRAKQNRSYLEQQVKLAETKLRESESLLVDFQKSTRFVSPDNKQGPGASQVELARLLTEKKELELQYATANAELAEIKLRLPIESGSKVESNKALRAALSNPDSLLHVLCEKAVKAQAELATENRKYTDEYATRAISTKGFDGLMDKIREQLQLLGADPTVGVEELTSMAHAWELQARQASLEARIKAYQDGLEKLNSSAQSVEQESQKLPDQIQQFETLSRDRRVNEELFTTLSQRLAGAMVDENSDQCDIRVFDLAQLPVEPLKPKPVLLAGVGAFMGILLGVCVAFSLEYLDDSFRTVQEVQSYLGLPVMAEIPRMKHVRRSSKNRLYWNR